MKKYELDFNEFSVDLLEFSEGSIMSRRTMLNIRIDREENKKETEQSIEDLKLITMALNYISSHAPTELQDYKQRLKNELSNEMKKK